MRWLRLGLAWRTSPSVSSLPSKRALRLLVPRHLRLLDSLLFHQERRQHLRQRQQHPRRPRRPKPDPVVKHLPGRRFLTSLQNHNIDVLTLENEVIGSISMVSGYLQFLYLEPQIPLQQWPKLYEQCQSKTVPQFPIDYCIPYWVYMLYSWLIFRIWISNVGWCWDDPEVSKWFEYKISNMFVSPGI